MPKTARFQTTSVLHENVVTTSVVWLKSDYTCPDGGAREVATTNNFRDPLNLAIGGSVDGQRMIRLMNLASVKNEACG